jgi:hypothetical protein
VVLANPKHKAQAYEDILIGFEFVWECISFWLLRFFWRSTLPARPCGPKMVLKLDKQTVILH